VVEHVKELPGTNIRHNVKSQVRKTLRQAALLLQAIIYNICLYTAPLWFKLVRIGNTIILMTFSDHFSQHSLMVLRLSGDGDLFWTGDESNVKPKDKDLIERVEQEKTQSCV
jgi:hypothetical protein